MDAVAVPPPPGLYLHVPFCLSKCAYCAFFSRCTDDETVAAWVRGVEQELHRLPSAFHPQTIYVGGGTPSLLPEKTWEQVLSLLHHHVDTSNVREWTVEMNPGTLTAEKAAFFKTVGVTRASLGIQSWNDDILAWLGRVHTAAQAKTAVELLHHAGFDNISMDLIYGLPDVPEERVMQDVDTTLSFEPQHISCYCLEVEPDTPLERRLAENAITPSPDAQREQYDAIRHRLAGKGMAHYELSNFAVSGHESRHNLLYWSGGDYIGIGPAAHSHWQGVRRGNTATLPDWHVDFEEQLPPEAKARETLVMGLRRTAGWTREEFRRTTGLDYDELCGATISRHLEQGLLLADADSLRLAPSAYFISDSIFADLI